MIKIKDTIKQIDSFWFLHTEVYSYIEFGEFFDENGKCLIDSTQLEIIITLSNSWKSDKTITLCKCKYD